MKNSQQLTLNSKEMYRALVGRDASYEGRFIVGVKTTGIFCRPTCRARKPKFTNVEFFVNTKAALDRGYRPCKVCRPMQPLGGLPEWLEGIVLKLHSQPTKRITDQDLRQQGVDPLRVRRWFNQHHGMTFQAYQRSLRMGHAFGQLKQGDKIVETAMDNGYDSLSGFTSAFKKKIGISPSRIQELEVIHVSQILTPLGPMLAGTTDKGVCLLEFTDRRAIETQFASLKKRLKAQVIASIGPHMQPLQKEIDEYFSGTRKKFEVPLHSPGTEFQQKVWQRLTKIPYGQTCSYKDQAVGIGNPKAVRAVARANGENRIAIIIPCHRVIGADGKLVGYGGKVWRKKALLELEGAHFRE